MRTIDYLDAARSRAGLPSDYALAARLGATRAAVSSWRCGRKFPDALHAFRLAELAQCDPAKALADMELERAERQHRDDAAAGWRSILQRIGGAAAMVAMVAGFGAAPSPSQAAQSVSSGNTLYIMLNNDDAGRGAPPWLSGPSIPANAQVRAANDFGLAPDFATVWGMPGWRRGRGVPRRDGGRADG